MYVRARSYFLNIKSKFLTTPDHVMFNIPFFSQWETPELVDQIISRKLPARNDPNWKLSGNINPEEYELWSWNLCGTTCLKMILYHQLKKKYRIFDLAKKITEYGGYVPKGNNTIDGLFYKPFIKYLKNEHLLEAEIASPLSIYRIQSELASGNYVMASVNQSIRDLNNPTPKIKSGHLVLITGYDKNKKVIYIHNPSGYYDKSQINHEIPQSEFKRFFSGKGIIIKSKDNNQ